MFRERHTERQIDRDSDRDRQIDCVCVCVCVLESERERERGGGADRLVTNNFESPKYVQYPNLMFRASAFC